MSAPRTLFIGGAADGKRIQINKTTRFVNFEGDTYQRLVVRHLAESVSVFCLQGASANHLLRDLTDNYRKRTVTEPQNG